MLCVELVLRQNKKKVDVESKKKKEKSQTTTANKFKRINWIFKYNGNSLFMCSRQMFLFSKVSQTIRIEHFMAEWRKKFTWWWPSWNFNHFSIIHWRNSIFIFTSVGFILIFRRVVKNKNKRKKRIRANSTMNFFAEHYHSAYTTK